MDFSIVIVNYNSGNFLYDCIQSILNNLKDISFEIVVVDNSSSDTSFLKCLSVNDKRLIFVQAGDNIGFSKANNLGVEHASGKIIHFINPDTQVSSSLSDDYRYILNDYSKKLHKVYVNPLRDKDGTTYYGKNPLPGLKDWIRYYLCKHKSKWYYIGASVIISSEDFKAIGGWNEKIFMYEEDADIFYRINKARLEIIELPSVIFHYGGGSSSNAFTNMSREVIIQKSLRIYFRSNNLSWLNYFFWQLLVLATFIKRPLRLWWQLKAIFKSFVE